MQILSNPSFQINATKQISSTTIHSLEHTNWFNQTQAKVFGDECLVNLIWEDGWREICKMVSSWCEEIIWKNV